MQWILFFMLQNASSASSNSQVLYSHETCELAAAAYVKNFTGDGVTAKAFCTPRTVDQYGAVRLDEKP